MGRTPYVGVIAAPTASHRRLAIDELEHLGIAHRADRPFSLLSGGERQLALIARALVQQSPVLVLDEPTAALDYGNEVRILQVVAELARAGRCVIMTTHQPAHALSYAGQVVLMRDGWSSRTATPTAFPPAKHSATSTRYPIHVVSVPVPGRPGHENASLWLSRTVRDGDDRTQVTVLEAAYRLIDFLFMNSSMPSGPSSRPMPERLMPPNGRSACDPPALFRYTIPASI